jgi:hypothetical protein
VRREEERGGEKRKEEERGGKNTSPHHLAHGIAWVGCTGVLCDTEMSESVLTYIRRSVSTAGRSA